jgi:PAS domain S-box-containing protein
MRNVKNLMVKFNHHLVNPEMNKVKPYEVHTEPWHILLVDDDEDDYFLTRAMLNSSQGRAIELDWADSYQAGMEKLASNHYHVVLVDYDLGNKSGIEMIRELTAREYPAPVILYTGRGSLEVDYEAMQAGATLYITKEEATPLLLERFVRYALERKHSEAALSADLKAMQLLHEVSTHYIENGDISTLLQVVVQAAIEISGADKGNLQMFNPDKITLDIVVQIGFEQEFLDYYSEVSSSHPSACGASMVNKQRVIVEDVENDPIFSGQPSLEVLRRAGVRAVQSTPLLTRSGQLVGILSTHWGRVHRPGSHTLQLIDLLARQAADFIERKRTEQALLEIGRLDAYRVALADALRTLRDPNEIQHTATRVLGEYLRANRVHYVDVLPNEEEALITQTYHEGVRAISGRLRLDEVGMHVFKCLKAGQKVVIEDVAAEANLDASQKARYTGAHYAAMIAVPLVKDDRLAAALVASSAEPRKWKPEEVDIVEETAERTWSAVERARAEAALRKSEERFRTMADGTPVIIWVTDPEGKIEFINKAYCDYFGVTDEEVQTGGWQPLVHPEDYADYVDTFMEGIESGQAFQAEARVRHQSGEWRWIVSFAQPLFSANGSVERMVGSTLDITDRKHALSALESYTEQLRQSNQALEDFAFVASHDLREPIRKVQAFAKQLVQQAGDRLDRSELDYLERMDQAAFRMQKMLDGLLAYSRISRQGERPDICDLNQVTAQTLSDLEYRIRETNARINVSELPVIHADPLQMHQLLLNLLTNALKFQQPHNPPHVKVFSRSDSDGFIEIIVEDNGVGFDMSMADKLFKPFNRLVGKSEFEGTGMGLAICAKIAERHGGSIAAQSEVGGGSTFTVRLPRSPKLI